MTEKNNDCLRLVNLGPEHIEEVRKALGTCARAGAQPWNADVNDYPGCMIDGDLKSGVAWGLFDDVGLVAYAVLDMNVDDEYGQVCGFDMSVSSATIIQPWILKKIGSFRRDEVDGEFTLYSRKI